MAEKAFENKSHVLTPYSPHGLYKSQNSSNCYIFRCCTTIEKTFGMVAGRLAILWVPLRHSVKNMGLILMVCFWLDVLIIETNWMTGYDMEWDGESGLGSPTVYTQNLLHLEFDPVRGRLQRESNLPRVIADRLSGLGLV